MTLGEWVFLGVLVALYLPLFRLLDRMTWESLLDGLGSIGRVPLLRVDGIVSRLSARPLGPFEPMLEGFDVIVNENVPEGRYYLLPGDRKILASSLAVRGGYVAWAEAPWA